MIEVIADSIIMVCLFALFTSIIINFFNANKKTKKEKKSIVETGTMTGFFLVFYALIRFNIGDIAVQAPWNIMLLAIGVVMFVFGTYVNIAGRFDLGRNWANQVKIYKDQTLIRTGMYKYIRHPLYASLIWMFYGAVLVHPNWPAFLANTFIFIPFMYYRAKQEEKLLSETFKDYKKYQKEVGMFFPRR